MCTIMDAINDIDAITKKYREKLQSLPWPKPGHIYVPKNMIDRLFNFRKVNIDGDNNEAIVMTKGNDGIYRMS